MAKRRQNVKVEVTRFSTVWGILVCVFAVGILLVEIIGEKSVSGEPWELLDRFYAANFGGIWIIGGAVSIWEGWLLTNPYRGRNIRAAVGWITVGFGLWGVGSVVGKGVTDALADKWDIADGVFYLVPFICWEIIAVQGWLLNRPWRERVKAGKGDYKFQVEVERTALTSSAVGGAPAQAAKHETGQAPVPMDMGPREPQPKIDLTPVINFRDRNLELAVRRAIFMPEGRIHQSSIEWLMSLDVSEQGITDITGLENFFNLTDLSLWGNKISDLTPISRLTKLTTLTLYMNHISDIKVLTGLPNLTYISLWNNQISDVSPLVQNEGLGVGDVVDLRANPLSRESLEIHIPRLQQRRVRVIK